MVVIFASIKITPAVSVEAEVILLSCRSSAVVVKVVTVVVVVVVEVVVVEKIVVQGHSDNFLHN